MLASPTKMPIQYKFNVHCVDCFFPCNDRLALIKKHGSLLGYLSSWPYPYHYGASFSIWFTTLSRSFRNPSLGKDIDSHVIHEQSLKSFSSSVFLLCILLGFYGWSQSTAWTVWVVYSLIKATVQPILYIHIQLKESLYVFLPLLSM